MADEKVYLGKDQLALVWQLIKNAFVAKVEGKGLSTNDFTNDLLTKLTGIQTGATAVANSAKNGAITINGKDETVYALPAATASLLGGVIIGAGLSIDDTGKLINAITKLSQLENDAGFITTADIPEGAAASTTTPKMDGTATTGTELAFARGDHVHPSDTTKVDKETGKGLSTNDLTNVLKGNYDAAYTHSVAPHAPSNAEKNVIVGIQKNGTDVSVNATTRKANIVVPTKVSDLTNDTGFITASEVPETYTLPDATSTVKGGVKIGNNVKVVGATISVDDASASAKGVVQLAIAATDDDTKAATAGALYDVNTDLSAKIAAKQSPATSLAGYGITDAYTKTEINSMVSSVLHYKGTKTSYSDLPKTGNVVGDVWNIENANTLHGVRAGDNVAWNGTAWDVLAGTIDLSTYLQTSELREITEGEIKSICV
jgi:hypothetical protein